MAVRSRVGGTSAAATSHSVTLPAGVIAGDRLLVGFVNDTADTASTSSTGWSSLGSAAQATNHRLTVFTKTATGSDALSVAVTGTDAAVWVSVCMQGDGGTPTLQLNSGATATTGAVTAITGLTSGNYDGVVFLGLDNSAGTSHTVTPPSGYGNTTTAGTSANAVIAASMDAGFTGVTSISPANVTWTNTEQWITANVAVGVVLTATAAAATTAAVAATATVDSPTAAAPATTVAVVATVTLVTGASRVTTAAITATASTPPPAATLTTTAAVSATGMRTDRANLNRVTTASVIADAETVRPTHSTTFTVRTTFEPARTYVIEIDEYQRLDRLGVLSATVQTGQATAGTTASAVAAAAATSTTGANLATTAAVSSAATVASLNNLLVNAKTLLNGTTQVTGSTADDTQEVGELRLKLNGTATETSITSGLHTVWFHWKAPSSTNATFTTVGSAFDSYLSVYKASPGETDPVSTYSQLTPLGSDDDGGGSGTSSVTIAVASGVIYYVQVSGFSAANYGAFTLNYPSPAP